MIVVIADDLTGAAEIAGIGWRHGLSVEILRQPQPPPRVDLVVYDLDSRDCSAAEAARRMRAVLGPLKRRRPGLIFQKVDSVLRGNVRAELEAAMAELRRPRCVLAPANPAAGRIIVRGQYFVGGKLIHKTGFRHDPGHPRTTADVIAMLGSGTQPVASVRPGRRKLPPGILIGDAANARAVQSWAAQVTPDDLAAGGADFFTALLQCSGQRPRVRGQAPGPRRGPLLLVSGSMADGSLALLQAWATERPVLLMPYELFTGRAAGQRGAAVWTKRIVAALKTHEQVAVGIGQPAQPTPMDRRRLGRLLTGAVQGALRQIQPDRICVEGGATAAQLIQRLGWRRLKVVSEFATGVVAVRPADRRHPVLVFKPGSYPWPATVFARAAGAP
jgi:uncharacterized protein YgbK (DUF1537 family)